MFIEVLYARGHLGSPQLIVAWASYQQHDFSACASILCSAHLALFKVAGRSRVPHLPLSSGAHRPYLYKVMHLGFDVNYFFKKLHPFSVFEVL